MFRVYPDLKQHPNVVVEVRICKNAYFLQRAVDYSHGERNAATCGRGVAGYVMTWYRLRRPFGGSIRPGRGRWVVAHMYLSLKDIRDRPSEIVSHECGHAAMGFARWRGARLGTIPGEEVMCHALGRLVAQVNRICFACGAWPR